MTEIAVHKNGTFSVATDFDDDAWELMKKNYRIGDFSMSCCGAPAIPKTSANGLKFFSHYSDECASAPDWIECILNSSFSYSPSGWKIY